MTTADVTAARTPFLTRTITGAAAGLVGGLAFGLLMQMEGMIPMVAMLVGGTSVAVGWFVHLVISVSIGGAFGLLLGAVATTPLRGIALGLVWGIVWWVLGALILMPAMLGMAEMIFVVETMQWKSLMGHLIYGLILGLLYATTVKRVPQR